MQSPFVNDVHDVLCKHTSLVFCVLTLSLLLFIDFITACFALKNTNTSFLYSTTIISTYFLVCVHACVCARVCVCVCVCVSVCVCVCVCVCE